MAQLAERLTSTPEDPRYESRNREFYWAFFIVNSSEKEKNKENEAGNGPLKITAWRDSLITVEKTKIKKKRPDVLKMNN